MTFASAKLTDSLACGWTRARETPLTPVLCFQNIHLHYHACLNILCLSKRLLLKIFTTQNIFYKFLQALWLFLKRNIFHFSLRKIVVQ